MDAKLKTSTCPAHSCFGNILVLEYVPSDPKHASETAYLACSHTATMHSIEISVLDNIAYLPKKKPPPNHFITDMWDWKCLPSSNSGFCSFLARVTSGPRT